MQPCAPVWWLCICWAYESGLLRPCLLSRESPSTHSLHPPAVAALWDTEPRLSHFCLVLLHSSNNANYISNGNRWGLVSSSHSLERFTNIHQRGHWSVWAPSFKGWTSQGAWGPDLLITPAVPHCCPVYRLHQADSFSRIISATLRGLPSNSGPTTQAC